MHARTHTPHHKTRHNTGTTHDTQHTLIVGRLRRHVPSLTVTCAGWPQLSARVSAPLPPRSPITPLSDDECSDSDSELQVGEIGAQRCEPAVCRVECGARWIRTPESTSKGYRPACCVLRIVARSGASLSQCTRPWKAGESGVHARSPTRTTNTRAHTPTQTHTHARALTHIHSHSHTRVIAPVAPTACTQAGHTPQPEGT
jgi:hypothetical protein